MQFCTFLCHSLSTLPGRQVDRPWSSGLGKAWNPRLWWWWGHTCQRQNCSSILLLLHQAQLRTELPFSELRGNLSRSQDDATAWGLLGFVVTSHPYGHGLSGLRPPGSFEGSGTNGLSLCTAPPHTSPGLHRATTCLHLTPTVQSHVAQHSRTIEPFGAGSCSP